MKRRGAWLGAASLVILFVGLGYAGWRAWRPSQAQLCQACSRPIHSHTRTVALVGSRRESFCCPACALTTHDQSGRPVKVVELTDFLTNSPLDPGEAYLVRASDVNMCARQHGPLGPDKQPTTVEFDRCSPSLLAFARKETATAFASEHGGEVLSFSQLAASYAR